MKLIRKKKRNNIYLVMCLCPLEFIGGILVGSGERYHIHSAWTSERKANKLCCELNSDKKTDWREDYGYGLFYVYSIGLSK